MQRPFPAYDGNEPYIFVSYAHSDSRVVYGELARVREAGFRVWYDEGINPGSRWTDDLAGRISGCSLVVMFVTPNSAASENCRNEIDFALEQQRNVLLVYLKPTELPGGMKLALSGRQAILKHEHSSAAYQEKLLYALEELVHGESSRVRIEVRKRNRLVPVLAGVAALVLVAGLVTYMTVEPPQRGEVTETRAAAGPLPVLIANFVNETDQPVFTGVLEEALKVGMEGAPFITSYSRKEAKHVLSELTDDNELTHEGARLVAVREGIELVLAGTVRQNANGYELEVLGIDSLSGEVILSESESAETPLEALTAIAELAEQLRRSLGDVGVTASHLEEVFTSSSMLAVAEFAQGQALAADWKHAEAVEHYEKAVELDNNFGRAYGGWGYSLRVLGDLEASAAMWEKCLARLNTMTERERLRTLGIYYQSVTGSIDKAIETFEELISKYPADAAAHNNLAVGYFSKGQFERASDTGRTLLDIYPSSLLYMNNYALFSMYAADTDVATEYAERTIEREPRLYTAYLPLVQNAVFDIDYPAAEQVYADMAESGVAGLSLANLGLGELLIARGDYEQAIELLGTGVAADELNGNSNSALIKSLLLARARIANGDTAEAQSVILSLQDSELSERHELMLAELQISLGDFDAALVIADRLAAKLPAQARAYAQLIRGMVALAQDERQQAIDFLIESMGIREVWLAHLMLGQAYLGMDAHIVEAMDEFDRAWEKRGEGFAMFLDDTPTYHRLVDLRYWQARSQEALGMQQDAAGNYREFIERRDLAVGDPLVQDALSRLAAGASVAAD